MKLGVLIAVGGAAIVIAGLSGCSSSDKSSSSEAGSGSESASASGASGGTKVVIDGQDKNIDGNVVCTAVGGKVNIAIGQGLTGIAAVLSEGDAPTVTSVGLGNVDGVTLAVGGGSGEAKATKDGKDYTITGKATGIDIAKPTSPVTKEFEIKVTCP